MQFNSDSCDWSVYFSNLFQPFKAQIVFNPPIKDVRINYCIKDYIKN